jgi:hypothetical protein
MESSGARLSSNLVLDGYSFYPQLTGKKGRPREWIFSHYDPKWGRFQPARLVSDKRWKLYEDGRFYDIENDPLEKNTITDLNDEQIKIKRKFQSVFEKMRL